MVELKSCDRPSTCRSPWDNDAGANVFFRRLEFECPDCRSDRDICQRIKGGNQQAENAVPKIRVHDWVLDTVRQGRPAVLNFECSTAGPREEGVGFREMEGLVDERTFNGWCRSTVVRSEGYVVSRD